MRTMLGLELSFSVAEQTEKTSHVSYITVQYRLFSYILAKCKPQTPNINRITH